MLWKLYEENTLMKNQYCDAVGTQNVTIGTIVIIVLYPSL